MVWIKRVRAKAGKDENSKVQQILSQTMKINTYGYTSSNSYPDFFVTVCTAINNQEYILFPFVATKRKYSWKEPTCNDLSKRHEKIYKSDSHWKANCRCKFFSHSKKSKSIQLFLHCIIFNCFFIFISPFYQIWLMKFILSFALTIVFNFLLFVRAWYRYQITKEGINFFKFLKKIFEADIDAISAFINIKLIKGELTYNVLTISLLILLLVIIVW